MKDRDTFQSVNQFVTQIFRIRWWTLNDFHKIGFRKKIYATSEELQADLDVWID